MRSLLPRPLRSAGRLLASPAAREDFLQEWRRKLGGEPRLGGGRPKSLLVICHGNLCRSPFAAALLEARLPDIEVRSAGLAASEGEPADPHAISAAARIGVRLEAHRTHRVTTADLGCADLVLGMEGRHLGAVARLLPGARGRARLLGAFLPAPPFTIPDPWGLSDAVFDATFARIDAAVARLCALLAEDGT